MQLRDRIEQSIQQINEIILGKDYQIRLCFSCLLAKGHLLIEDLPGMGKTTLSHALANVLGMEYQRIQFTSDLLPADILGASIYNKNEGTFSFIKGPIFSQLVLVDEINRSTPKTQSALLEAMEERQVTIEGETRPLPDAFFVIATQNPTYQIGTFPLPESQLDRFLMCIELGYPSKTDERLMLQGEVRRSLLERIKPSLTLEELQMAQQEVADIHVSGALLDYLQSLIHCTRNTSEFDHGLSPRGSLALLGAAKAWAYLSRREHVMPEDLQVVFGPVVTHRLQQVNDHQRYTAEQVTERILSSVPVV